MLKRVTAIFTAALAISLFSTVPAVASSALDLPGCRDTMLHRNDDESSGEIEIPFEIDFYGHSYHSLYLNNNGNVTFDAALGDYVPFDLTQTSRVIIAPFFADVDTRPVDAGTVTYGETTYEGRPAFCALWDEVGYYPDRTDLRNTFQLLIVRGTPGTGNFDIVFRYKNIQWDLGSASGGVSARAGFSNGEAPKSVEIAGSAVNGAFLDSGPSALAHRSLDSPDPGVWVFHIRGGTAGNDPRNVPAGFDRSVPWWNWPDGDEDGLPDNWERNGVWVGDRHVDLPGMGANPERKDAFVYVDVVEGERWNPTIESMLRASFRNSPLGIDLHIIRAAKDLQRSQVPAAVSASDAFFAHMVRLGFTDTGLSGTPGSVPALAKYVCACPDHVRGGGVGGEANGIKADHLVLTVYEAKWLDDIKRETGISFPNDALVGDRLNAISVMHELGHLYGLKHHGSESLPSGDRAYRSIMSYAYNAFGVPRSPDDALASGDLLPRIDYSRENSVNYDWRMGGGFGQLSLVYGQHGERGDFYTSVDDIPDGAEEAPEEEGIEELLANPESREQIVRGAEEVAAAMAQAPAPAAASPTSSRSVTPGRLKLLRLGLGSKIAIASLRCDSDLPCTGKLKLVVSGEPTKRGNGRTAKTRRAVIGGSRFTLAPNTRQRLRIPLSSYGIDLIRQAGKRGLRVTILATGLPRETLLVAD